MDPVGALIGAVLLGFGVVILFGAVKNKKVFGDNGIIPTALTTGTISNLDKIPSAFPTISLPIAKTAIQTLGEAVAGNPTATWLIPLAVRNAIINISKTNQELGTRIAVLVDDIDSNTTRVELQPLAQLLAVADGWDHLSDVNVIRLYVKELTGESI